MNTFINVLDVKRKALYTEQNYKLAQQLFKLYGADEHLPFHCVGFTALIASDVSLVNLFSRPEGNCFV